MRAARVRILSRHLAVGIVVLVMADLVVATARETAADRTDVTSPLCASTVAPSLPMAPATSISAAAAAVTPSIVSLTATSTGVVTVGAGIIIRSDGVILTNNHVVADVAVGGGRISARFSDGHSAPADIIGRKPDHDIALVKVSTHERLAVATLGSSTTLRVGDEVIAVGNPYGEAGSVTSGIVSALRRAECIDNSDADPDAALYGLQPALPAQTNLKNLIQTDAPINPGSSGGALADLGGRVVGVCTLAKTVDGTSANTGIGFAIPIELAYADALALLQNGR